MANLKLIDDQDVQIFQMLANFTNNWRYQIISSRRKKAVSVISCTSAPLQGAVKIRRRTVIPIISSLLTKKFTAELLLLLFNNPLHSNADIDNALVIIGIV